MEQMVETGEQMQTAASLGYNKVVRRLAVWLLSHRGRLGGGRVAISNREATLRRQLPPDLPRRGRNQISAANPIEYRWACPALVCILLLGTAIGCEDESLPVGPAPVAPVTPSAPAIPQGRDLLTAPRKPLLLDVLPFTLDVPEGWKIVRHGDRPSTSLSILEGQLPSGDRAHIILSMRDTISADRLATTIKRMEKDRATIEAQGGKFVVRDIGEVRLVDRRERVRARGTATTLPVTPTTVPTTAPVDGSIDWRMQLFVPTGIGKFSQYELNFMDLNAEQFAQDEAFLDSILATLKYAEAPPPM